MNIIIKNNNILSYDTFKFKCCIGKNGKSLRKKEGDKKTPKGRFGLGYLFYRSDRNAKPFTKINCIEIKKNMGWCHDIKSKKYSIFRLDILLSCE